jgi:hypothetical protein
MEVAVGLNIHLVQLARATIKAAEGMPNQIRSLASRVNYQPPKGPPGKPSGFLEKAIGYKPPEGPPQQEASPGGATKVATNAKLVSGGISGVDHSLDPKALAAAVAKSRPEELGNATFPKPVETGGRGGFNVPEEVGLSPLHVGENGPRDTFHPPEPAADGLRPVPTTELPSIPVDAAQEVAKPGLFDRAKTWAAPHYDAAKNWAGKNKMGLGIGAGAAGLGALAGGLGAYMMSGRDKEGTVGLNMDMVKAAKARIKLAMQAPSAPGPTSVPPAPMAGAPPAPPAPQPMQHTAAAGAAQILQQKQQQPAAGS